QRIRLYQDVGSGVVKAIHESAEFNGAHVLGQSGRTAHVYKQHGQLHFRAALKLPDIFETGITEARILSGLASAEQRHHEPPEPAERRTAKLAARIGRDELEQIRLAVINGLTRGENLTPLLVDF